MAKKNKCEGKPSMVLDGDYLIATYCCEKHAKEAATKQQKVVEL